MHSTFFLVAGATCLLSVTNAAPEFGWSANWESEGCIQEPLVGRLLNGPTITSPTMTLEVCANYCREYLYFGVELGNRCYCGDSLNPLGTSVPITECNIPCVGDPLQLCGSDNDVSLYQRRRGGGGVRGGGGRGGGRGGRGRGRGGNDNHSKWINKADNSVNIDDSIDNSSFLSPSIEDDSRNRSPDIANGIANGDHKLSTDTTVHTEQDNEQDQAAAVDASPRIDLKNAVGSKIHGY